MSSAVSLASKFFWNRFGKLITIINGVPVFPKHFMYNSLQEEFSNSLPTCVGTILFLSWHCISWTRGKKQASSLLPLGRRVGGFYPRGKDILKAAQPGLCDWKFSLNQKEEKIPNREINMP